MLSGVGRQGMKLLHVPGVGRQGMKLLLEHKGHESRAERLWTLWGQSLGQSDCSAEHCSWNLVTADSLGSVWEDEGTTLGLAAIPSFSDFQTPPHLFIQQLFVCGRSLHGCA